MKQAGESIRSFLAFEISDASKGWIEERKQEMMRSMKGTIRWVKREVLHVTLHFFGKIPPKSIEKVEEIFIPLTSEFPAFTLRVKGIGAFPNRRNPRVLWTGIEEMSKKPQLRTFIAAMQAALREGGFPVENRPFTPHVTIGRVKRFLSFNWDNFRDLPICPPFTVSEITLFRSDLSRKGPIYQPLNHFPLGGIRHD